MADGYHLWSRRYDRELEDIFAIQDEIAESVVEALRLELSPHEKRALRKARPADLEAYDHYLRGRQLADSPSRESLLEALDMFRKAIAIDPSYAPAWAGIADVHSWLFAWYGAADHDYEEADRASQKAVELAPDSAEAHVSRGHVLSLSSDPGAETAFSRAIELNPGLYDAYWHFGRYCFRCGWYERAAELLEQAAAVRPEDYQALLLAPQFYRSLGQIEAARDAQRRGIERARKRLEINPYDHRALYLSANALHELGQTEEADRNVQRALALRPGDPAVLYNVGCYYSLTGDIDKSIDCLERAIDHNFGLREWFEHDSDLDNVREHPRYGALMERVRVEYAPVAEPGGQGAE